MRSGARVPGVLPLTHGGTVPGARMHEWRAQVPDLPVMEFASAKAWERVVGASTTTSSPGVWLKIAKKGTGVDTVTMPEVIDVALCYGWIDGLRHKHDDVYFRQRMTPRTARSRWSKINRDKAEALIAAGRMRAAGHAGRSTRPRPTGGGTPRTPGSRTIEVPDDLTRALRRNAKARRAFEQLDSTEPLRDPLPDPRRQAG